MSYGIHEVEVFANDEHVRARRKRTAGKLALIVAPMRLTPILERSVTFSFGGCVPGSHLSEPHDLDARRSNGTLRHAGPVRHDMEIAGLWQRLTANREVPLRRRRRALLPSLHQFGEAIRIGLIVG